MNKKVKNCLRYELIFIIPKFKFKKKTAIIIFFWLQMIIIKMFLRKVFFAFKINK